MSTFGIFSSGSVREARRREALEVLAELRGRATEVGVGSISNESVPRLEAEMRSARRRWELELAIDEMNAFIGIVNVELERLDREAMRGMSRKKQRAERPFLCFY